MAKLGRSPWKYGGQVWDGSAHAQCVVEWVMGTDSLCACIVVADWVLDVTKSWGASIGLLSLR
jgi:hypothetical protein